VNKVEHGSGANTISMKNIWLMASTIRHPGRIMDVNMEGGKITLMDNTRDNVFMS
jgi:hypothetical protein